ncbi:hypothetical protein ACFXI6_47940 [Streptomyces mirabilis]|uniref:hypothetical protein n=1 Tax=Streptomyces mirabilis TaxID=68239 RepID=UPI00369B2AB9
MRDTEGEQEPELPDVDDQPTGGELTPRGSLPDTPGVGEADGSDLPGDLQPEVRRWVLRFRLLLKQTGLSARAYAARHDISTGTLTNYRKGRTMPKESAVQTLLNDQPPHLTEEVIEQTWQLWEDALRVSSRHEYAKHQLRGKARRAAAKAESLQVLVETLSNDVVAKDARIADLTKQVEDLKDSFAQDAVDNQVLLTELNQQIADLTAERDKLRRSEGETRRHLADAERTRDAARQQASDLAAQLVQIEEQNAPELNGDPGPADASETITALELRVQELQQLVDQDHRQSSYQADRINALEWEAKEQREKKRKARQALTDAAASLMENRAQSDRLQRTYDELVARHDELGTKYSALTAQFGELKQRNTSLQSATAAYQRTPAASPSLPRRPRSTTRARRSTPTGLLAGLTLVNIVASYIVGNGFAHLQHAKHDTVWQLALYAALAVGIALGSWIALDDELTDTDDFTSWMCVMSVVIMTVSVFLPDIPVLHTLAVNLQSSLNPD